MTSRGAVELHLPSSITTLENVFQRSQNLKNVFFLQQLDALIAASMSVKSSSKLKKLLEVRLRRDAALFCSSRSDSNFNMSDGDLKVVLAFGNYMNSSKRGVASGFRLQSLDLVSANMWRTEEH